MSSRDISEVQAARAFSLKNYARASKHLNELLKDVGENPHTLHLLALCHARQDDIRQALAFAERALRADERHLESLKLLGELHFLGGDASRARHYVERALVVARAEFPPAPASRGWIAAIAAMTARLRARGNSTAHGPAAAREHRQWLEWAEAFLAQSAPGDDDAS